MYNLFNLGKWTVVSYNQSLLKQSTKNKINTTFLSLFVEEKYIRIKRDGVLWKLIFNLCYVFVNSTLRRFLDMFTHFKWEKIVVSKSVFDSKIKYLRTFSKFIQTKVGNHWLKRRLRTQDFLSTEDIFPLKKVNNELSLIEILTWKKSVSFFPPNKVFNFFLSNFFNRWCFVEKHLLLPLWCHLSSKASNLSVGANPIKAISFFSLFLRFWLQFD